MKSAIRLGLLTAAVLLVTLLLGCSIGAADGYENVTDMTYLCSFSVSANSNDLYLLVDDNPNTNWISDDDENQYLDISKPTEAATLNVIWHMPAPVVSIEQYANGQWEVLDAFYGEEDMPKTFSLPEGATRMRLRGNAQMSLTEVRVLSGEQDDSFPKHVFQFAAVQAKLQIATTPQPLQRGVRGEAVQDMQARLVSLGFNIAGKPTSFGEGTYTELVRFQRANGLRETGILDPRTARRLYSDTAISATPKPSPAAEEALVPRTASEMVSFVNGRIGSGYVYGSTGDVCSKDFRANRAKMYPHYEQSLETIAKQWDGMEVYDCIGLFKAFLVRSEGEILPEWNTNVIGAASRWMSEVQSIETMPHEPGLLLLQKDPTTGAFCHIGIYTGNGKCVHARGHSYGVVEESMPQLWTHWARASWLTYDLPVESETQWPTYLAGGSRALIKTSYGGDLPVYTAPATNGGQFTGTRLPNNSVIVIDAVPKQNVPGGSFWRQVTTTDSRGRTLVGYVQAKDLMEMPATMAFSRMFTTK